MVGVGRNEVRQPVLAGRADAHAVHPARMPVLLGFGVDGIQHVVVVDEQAADAAVLVVDVEQVPVLVEDLDAVVAAVGDEQPALRVEGEPVGRPELAGPKADLAPLLDEVAVLVELQDPPGRTLRRVGVLSAVAVRDEDVAVRRRDHVARLVELARAAARHPRFAQAHQLLALGAELDHLVPLGARLVAFPVGHPHVAVRVHVQAVRRDEQTGAEARQHLARLAIELEDGIEVRGVLAGLAQAAAAAVVGPDVPVVRVDVDAGRGAPLAVGGHLRPIQDHLRRRVRQGPHHEVARQPRIGCGRRFRSGNGRLPAAARR